MTIPLNGTTASMTADPASQLLPHHEGTTTDILADTSPGPFEGPEKLLEIWFASSKDELPTGVRGVRTDGEVREAQVGLRRVPREVWEDMLRIVRCQVLSVIEGEEIDAYLLR